LNPEPWLPRFVCPECRVGLGREGSDAQCPVCGSGFERRGGVHRFLVNGRRAAAGAFLEQYRAVRDRDGHRSTDPKYYRMLPSVPRDHPQASEWRIRRESYGHLQRHAIPAIWLGPARILELGAGCAWLSHRLATLGHRVVAVDRLDDDADGLGACRHYPVVFPAVQADFDALPFEPQQFDVVVFAGSLHYAADVAATLREAQRMLTPGGAMAVMDSPMFTRDADGEAMVADELRRMQRAHGFVPVRGGLGFLTYRSIDRAFEQLGLRARFHPSRGPLAWQLRRQVARFRLRRSPAAFGVWVAR
jgi:SAM-dependent methyltransferase